MKINEALNVVMPIFDDEGNTVAWIHAVPLPRLTFETHYKLLANTFASIYAQGLNALFGPRVSSLILRELAVARGIDPEPLFNEIKRLASFIGPGANGWESMPLHSAIVSGRLNEDDAAEVMNALVFFIAASGMLPKTQVREILPGAMRIWGAVTMSLTATAWIASLSMSTVPATSTAPAPSAIPNPTGEALPEVRRVVMVNGRPT